jgi:cytochrome c oxidase subunit 3
MSSPAAQADTEVPAHADSHVHAVHRDYAGAKIGMWLFLFTEILLFGGLFILYSAYRAKYPHEFHEAGNELNFVIGVINTVVLLTSSLSMALSISAVQKGNRRLSMILLAATVVLGGVFLVNKYFEWMVKIHHGLYPNGPELLKRKPGEILFFGLYFTMTGLHGLHVIAGMIVLSILLVLLAKGRIDQDDYIKLENGGLYWHLVDVIWIFLLPLFYLAA